MVKGLLGSRALQWVDLEQPANEVDEVLVFTTAQTLLQSRLLCNQDVDLEFFIGRSWLLLLLLTLASTFSVIISLLIDQALSSEEV